MAARVFNPDDTKDAGHWLYRCIGWAQDSEAWSQIPGFRAWAVERGFITFCHHKFPWSGKEYDATRLTPAGMAWLTENFTKQPGSVATLAAMRQASFLNDEAASCH